VGRAQKLRSIWGQTPNQPLGVLDQRSKEELELRRREGKLAVEGGGAEEGCVLGKGREKCVEEWARSEGGSPPTQLRQDQRREGGAPPSSWGGLKSSGEEGTVTFVCKELGVISTSGEGGKKIHDRRRTSSGMGCLPAPIIAQSQPGREKKRNLLTLEASPGKPVPSSIEVWEGRGGEYELQEPESDGETKVRSSDERKAEGGHCPRVDRGDWILDQ